MKSTMKSTIKTTPRARPVITTKNLFREVCFSLQQHHKQVIATVASASIGIFGLVAGIGISRTRDAQTLNRFDALAATQLTAQVQLPNPLNYPVEFPADAQERLEAINGIVSTGTYDSLTVKPKLRFPALLRAASPSLFPTVQATFVTGRPFTVDNNRNGDRVCVIGKKVASQFGIVSLANRPNVQIGNETFEVLGILAKNEAKPELREAILLPTVTAERFYKTKDRSISIRTSVNATNLPAGVMSSQIQLTLSNAFPEAIQVSQPSSLTNVVRDSVASDLSSGFAFLASLLVALTIATITISTSSAVQTRTHEIGLRRALGAARKHIRRQFILEAALIGGIASIVGTLAGLLATLFWAHRNQWNVVQDRITIPAALLAGPVIGILGSVWPAWRASRQQPADTLRSL